MYLAGELARTDATLLEAVCLIEALGRLGITSDVGPLVAKASKANVAAAILSDQMAEGDLCLFVRARGWRRPEIELAFHEREKDERGVHVDEQIEWIGAVGKLPHATREEFEVAWNRALTAFRESPIEESLPFWERSRVRSLMRGLEASVRSVGFEVRA